MARTILAAAAVVWLVAGAAAIGVGLLGATGLQRLLPPLAIDLAALGGAVVAVGITALLVGAVHAAVVLSLGTRRRLAETGAVLLSSTLGMLLVAVSATAATGAARTPERALPMLLGGLAALLGAAAYGVATGSVVASIRARRRN